MKNKIIKFSAILLAGLLIEWWLTHFSFLNLPENIPHTPIRIGGLILIGLLLTTMIIAHKQFLKINPDITILKLTIAGSLICLISETIFQILRQAIYDNTLTDRIYYFALSTIGITIFGTVFSFFVAFQLKTNKTRHLVLFIVVFLVLINIVQVLRGF